MPAEIPNKILEGILALMESQGKHADALKLILDRQDIQSSALAKMMQAMLELTPMLKDLKAQLGRIEKLCEPDPSPIEMVGNPEEWTPPNDAA